MNKYKLVDCSLMIKESRLGNIKGLRTDSFKGYEIIALGHIGNMIIHNDLLFIPVLLNER